MWNKMHTEVEILCTSLALCKIFNVHTVKEVDSEQKEKTVDIKHVCG